MNDKQAAIEALNYKKWSHEGYVFLSKQNYETIRAALQSKTVDVEELKIKVLKHCLYPDDNSVFGTYDEKQHFNGRGVGICQAIDFLTKNGYRITKEQKP